MSFECGQPFVPDNTEVEFARLKITGQSFMMHQIRRMVGLVIAIMRGYRNEEVLSKALQQEKMLIPQAPGLGLVLDNVHYPRYNERYSETHEALLFEEEDDAVEEFFRKHILSTIIETELRDKAMLGWIEARLRDHVYDASKREEKEADDNDECLSD